MQKGWILITFYFHAWVFCVISETVDALRIGPLIKTSLNQSFFLCFYSFFMCIFCCYISAMATPPWFFWGRPKFVFSGLVCSFFCLFFYFSSIWKCFSLFLRFLLFSLFFLYQIVFSLFVLLNVIFLRSNQQHWWASLQWLCYNVSQCLAMYACQHQ